MNKVLPIGLLVLIAISTTTICQAFAKSNKSQDYKDGFAAGVKLADTNFKAVGPEKNHVNPADLDCDSDVDPREANPDYCDGVNDGYAQEANRLSGL